jgi:hypothetical protein
MMRFCKSLLIEFREQGLRCKNSIRPLLSQDLKIRHVSGRRQISAAGVHLVDGIPFGKPLLRKPDRPAVNIPPRKKRRVTYQEADEDDESFAALKEKEAQDSEDDGNRQLVLHADFDDDDDDEDFAPGEEDADEDMEESEEELEHDEDKNIEVEKNQSLPPSSPTSQAPGDEADESVLTKISDPATRAKIRKLHSAFPKSPLAVCKYVLVGSEGDMGEAYEALNRGFVPVKPKSAITEISQDANLSVPKTRSRKRKALQEEPEALDSMQVEANETQDSLIDYYDRNGLPEGSITSGKALLFMAEAAKSSPLRSRPESRRSASVISNKSVRFAVDESLSNGLTSTPFIDKETPDEESSEEESDDTSSDEEATSSSDSSSDSSDEDVEQADEDSTSSSGSDSDSSSESSSEDESPEETSSKIGSTNSPAKLNAQNSSEYSKQKPESPAKTNGHNSSSQSMEASIPHQGKASTKARNARRRNANVLNRFKEKGILPAGTTFTEFNQLNIDDNTPANEALAALEAVRARLNEAATKSDDFELRRQELLASLASGGIEVGQEISKPAPKTLPVEVQDAIEVEISTETLAVDAAQSQEISKVIPSAPEQWNPPSSSVSAQKEPTTEVELARPSTAPEAPSLDTPLPPPTPQPTSAQPSRAESSGSRRAKLDLGAGRRMLFNALGVRAPKTKKDEEKVRSDLMKDIRPQKISRPTEEPQTNVSDELVDEDPEAWREKISYRAVECVEEGVELSEPPFPFVQRWDPQQQGWSQNGNRGGKRKKEQRNQAQYYNEDPRASKKQKRRKGKHTYAEEQEYLEASYEPSYQDESTELQYDDSTQMVESQNDEESQITQQLMNDISTPTGFSQGPEDLAPLPEDPSSLPDLKDGSAKVGMTIAFKKLELSAATKWQPEISPYRTAIVIEVAESGELHLSLAMRDREQSNKIYDQETGERIYNKFEVPDDDDQPEEEDDGMLNISFGELVDPKIVQGPPPNLVNEVIIEMVSQQEEGPGADEFTSLSHAEEQEAQFSHVTETPLNSDAVEPDVRQQEGDEDEKGDAEVDAGRVAQGSPSQAISLVAKIWDDMRKIAPTLHDPPPTLRYPFSDLSSNKPPFLTRAPFDGPSNQATVKENVQGSVHGVTEPDLSNQRAEEAGLKESIQDSVQAVPEPDLPQQRAEETDLQDSILDSVPDVMAEESLPANPQTPGADSLPLPVSVNVSDKSRREISHLMKEAGFRSSVPSSIMRDIRPDGMDSPGDAAVFEKLLNDMTEISPSKPYSPKFNGLGSRSPTKSPRKDSHSPAKAAPGPSRSPVAESKEASESPEQLQSSWQTIDSRYESSISPQARKVGPSPLPAPQESSSWVTVESQQPPSSPLVRNESPSPSGARQPSPSPVREPENRASEKKIPVKKVPYLGKAQKLWEGLQPKRKRRKSADSSASSSKASPGPAFGLDGVDETPSVRYPKLSLGSSFTSQVTDHGRQPDFSFDDTAGISAGTSKALTPINDFHPDEESEHEPSISETNNKSDVEPDRPTRKTFSIADDCDSSDFPAVEEVYHSQKTKREKPSPGTVKKTIKEDIDRNDRKPMVLDDDSDSDQVTPKASQKQRKLSQSRSKSRTSEKAASQQRVSIPRASQSRQSQSQPFVLPPNSQVMDLTISSDAEPEPEDESDVAPPNRTLKRYDLSDEDDEDYVDPSGWVPKSNNVRRVETRRQTSVGLRDSSQASLNAQNRRKTTAR